MLRLFSVGLRSLPRHCEEPSRRSNPDCFRGNTLGCFAALAMTSLWDVRVATPALSSSAKADDPVFHQRRWLHRDAAAYWMPRLRGA
ncbi:hypothetical protein CO669_10715 [Bradyrhizobium sp. Y36]|nr:hypothetical protein CO669_10715 [Bradyrhizobium sp. Y36]